MNLRLLPALAALGVLATACASDSGAGADAGAWSDGACKSAMRLIDSIEPAAEELETKIDDLATSADPSAGFATFITAFGELIGEMAEPFSQLAADMEALGAPDVEGGQEYFDQLSTALAEANEAIDNILAVFDTLPENPTLDDLAALEQLGNDDAFAGLESIGSLRSDAPEELATALDNSETCAAAEARFAELQAKFDSLA